MNKEELKKYAVECIEGIEYDINTDNMTDKVTEPPPNMVRGAKVASSQYVLAAGNYKQSAGKVVHELPLPPPKLKRYDISRKYSVWLALKNSLENTRRWDSSWRAESQSGQLLASCSMATRRKQR